jgi:putative SOS response-associated peptidase YedK
MGTPLANTPQPAELRFPTIAHYASVLNVAGGEDGPLATYTIMTVDSSPRLSWLHDRMPVVLEDDAAVQAWLQGKDSKAQVRASERAGGRAGGAVRERAGGRGGG